MDKSEGADHPGISNDYSSHPRDIKILMKSKDQGSDPSDKIVLRIPFRGSPTGHKSGKMIEAQVWTDTYQVIPTWTLKCPVRGNAHGTFRKPIT